MNTQSSIFKFGYWNVLSYSINYGMLLIVIGWTRGKVLHVGVIQTFQPIDYRFPSEAVVNFFFFKSIIAELLQVSFAEKNCLQVIFQIYLKFVILRTGGHLIEFHLIESLDRNFSIKRLKSCHLIESFINDSINCQNP